MCAYIFSCIDYCCRGTVYSLKKSENKAFFLLQQSVVKYQTLLKAGNPKKLTWMLEKILN